MYVISYQKLPYIIHLRKKKFTRKIFTHEKIFRCEIAFNCDSCYWSSVVNTATNYYIYACKQLESIEGGKAHKFEEILSLQDEPLGNCYLRIKVLHEVLGVV